MKDLYYYKAFVTGVYDGDSITVDIDLGLNIWTHAQKIRLANINTPELRGDEREAGLISRDWLRNKILGKEIILKIIKDKKGKYGRWIGEIWLDEGTEYANINMLLVTNGLAEEVEY